jgi:phosphopantothenoylcysteine synthetase/decarboxylase
MAADGAQFTSVPSTRLAVITCGPSYEPIDEVRRITNHSTGELGLALANRLADAGWRVECFLGTGATHHAPLEPGVHRHRFTTNEDLLRRLVELPEREKVGALFHAAALCDFRVKRTVAADGAALESPKISSRAGGITVELEPAPKIIGELRPLFPNSAIVGWKYELSGTVEGVWHKGRRQIEENRTDLCVVNGAAYGEGFGILERDGARSAVRGKAELAAWLLRWLPA